MINPFKKKQTPSSLSRVRDLDILFPGLKQSKAKMYLASVLATMKEAETRASEQENRSVTSKNDAGIVKKHLVDLCPTTKDVMDKPQFHDRLYGFIVVAALLEDCF